MTTPVFPHPACARKTGMHWLLDKGAPVPHPEPRFVALQWNAKQRVWSHSGQGQHPLDVTAETGYSWVQAIPEPNFDALYS